MRKRHGFIIILSLVLLLTGCGGTTDSLKMIQKDEGTPNLESVSYEVNIGNKVGSGTLVAELWKNGECVEGSPMEMNDQTKKINISLLMNGDGTEDAATGLTVQTDTDNTSGSVLTYFEIPRIGYTFSSYDAEETIGISKDDEVILAAMAFDSGSGVSSIDCKKLVSEPNTLSSYECIVVVRANFSSEQVEPKTES